MANNLWDDETVEEFRDVPEEAETGSKQVQNGIASSQPAMVVPSYRPSNIPAEPVVQRQAPRQQVVSADTQEVDLEDLGIEQEEDFTEVLNDANLRIEQGRLYQMIMNHDLFQGMEADERAVDNVQREIRKFARERMEIMLGMRQEQVAQSANMVSSPFNDLEVDILKKIASKATNGATETAEANEIAQVVKAPPKRTLTPIGGTTAMKRPQTPQRQAPQGKALQARTQAPIKRSKMDLTIDQIAAEEGIPRELLEENYKPIGKPLHELTPQELAQREKETAARLRKHTTVKSASALPMATPEQAEMIAMQRATQISSAPGMAALLAKVQSMPVKNT